MATLPPIDDGRGRGRDREPPEAVEKLGLSLPVTPEDVKRAFRKRAQEAHPDHGGDASEFVEVQRAFDEAIEFAKRNKKRLPWIGSQMPIYIAQRDAVELVESLDGRVTIETIDWLEGTVGDDFAAMGDRLTAIDLSGTAASDADLGSLTSDPTHLPFLHTVNVAGTRVTDAGAMRLTRLPALKRLDVRGAPVSSRLARQLAKMPGIESVEATPWWRAWLGG